MREKSIREKLGKIFGKWIVITLLAGILVPVAPREVKAADVNPNVLITLTNGNIECQIEGDSTTAYTKESVSFNATKLVFEVDGRKLPKLIVDKKAQFTIDEYYPVLMPSAEGEYDFTVRLSNDTRQTENLNNTPIKIKVGKISVKSVDGKFNSDTNLTYAVYGQNVTISATPISSTLFGEWRKNGVRISDSNPHSFYVNDSTKGEYIPFEKVTPTDITLKDGMSATAEIFIGQSLNIEDYFQLNPTDATGGMTANHINGSSNTTAELSPDSTKIVGRNAGKATFEIVSKSDSNVKYSSFTVKVNPLPTGIAITSPTGEKSNVTTISSDTKIHKVGEELTLTAFAAGATNYKWSITNPNGVSEEKYSTSTTPAKYILGQAGKYEIKVTEPVSGKNSIINVLAYHYAPAYSVELVRDKITKGYTLETTGKAYDKAGNELDLKVLFNGSEKFKKKLTGDGEVNAVVENGKLVLSGTTITAQNETSLQATYEVFDVPKITYDSDDKNLTIELPDSVYTSSKESDSNLTDITGYEIELSCGGQTYTKTYKDSSSSYSSDELSTDELSNIVKKFVEEKRSNFSLSSDSDYIKIKLTPLGTSEKNLKEYYKAGLSTSQVNGPKLYRVTTSGTNMQTKYFYGLVDEEIEIKAEPSSGCTFSKWDDGNSSGTTRKVKVKTSGNTYKATGAKVTTTPTPKPGTTVPKAGGAAGDGLDSVPKTAQNMMPFFMIMFAAFAAAAVVFVLVKNSMGQPAGSNIPESLKLLDFSSKNDKDKK